MKKITLVLLLTLPCISWGKPAGEAEPSSTSPIQKIAPLQKQQIALLKDFQEIRKNLIALLARAGQAGELQLAKQTLEQQYNSFHPQYQQFLKGAYGNYLNSYKNLNRDLRQSMGQSHSALEKEKENADLALKEIKGLYADILTVENSLKQETKGKDIQKDLQGVINRLQDLSALLKMPELAPKENKTLIADYMALFHVEGAPTKATQLQLQKDMQKLQQTLKKGGKWDKFKDKYSEIQSLISKGKVDSAAGKLNKLFDFAREQAKGDTKALTSLRALQLNFNKSMAIANLKAKNIAAQEAMSRADRTAIPPLKGTAKKKRAEREDQTSDPRLAALSAATQIPVLGQKAKEGLYSARRGKDKRKIAGKQEDLLKSMSSMGLNKEAAQALLEERKAITRSAKEAAAKADEGKGFFARAFGKVKRFFGKGYTEDPQQLNQWMAKTDRLIVGSQDGIRSRYEQDRKKPGSENMPSYWANRYLDQYGSMKDKYQKYQRDALARGDVPKNTGYQLWELKDKHNLSSSQIANYIPNAEIVRQRGRQAQIFRGVAHETADGTRTVDAYSADGRQRYQRKEEKNRRTERVLLVGKDGKQTELESQTQVLDPAKNIMVADEHKTSETKGKVVISKVDRPQKPEEGYVEYSGNSLEDAIQAAAGKHNLDPDQLRREAFERSQTHSDSRIHGLRINQRGGVWLVAERFDGTAQNLLPVNTMAKAQPAPAPSETPKVLDARDAQALNPQANPPPQQAGFGLALLNNPAVRSALASGAKSVINLLSPGLGDSIASIISAFRKK